jgi:autotransporter translocation and assembly factor TamB
MNAPRRQLTLAFWIPFGLLFLLAAGAAWWVSRNGENWTRARLEEELSRRLGASVVIGRLEIDLVPPTTRAYDVLVERADGVPLATARVVEVSMFWPQLRSRPLRIQSVAVDGLELYVERDAEGRFHWLELEGGDGGGAGVAIDRLTVRDGHLRYADRKVPLDLTLAGFLAQASGSSVDGFAARLEAADTVVGLPTGATYAGAVSARATWDAGRLRVVHARLGGPDLQATVTGGGWEREDGSWGLDFTASGAAGLLRRLGVSDSDVAGTWSFAGTLGGLDSWSLGGVLTASDLTFEDKTLRNLQASLHADPDVLRLDGIHGRFARGAVEAAVEVRWAEDEKPVRVEAEVTDGDIPALMAEFGLEGLDLVGRWNAAGVYTCPAADPMAGEGTFDAELFAADRAGRLTWHRRVPLDVRNGSIDFRTLPSDLDAERFTVGGTHDLRTGAGSMQYRADTLVVDAWLDVFGLRDDPDTARWLPAAGQGTLEGTLNWAPGDWSTRLSVDLTDVALGEIAVDEVRGALSASPAGVQDLRLDFSRPDGALLLSGGILATDPALFDLAIETSGWPSAELVRQLELPLDVAGPLDASIAVGGDSDDLVVTARLAVAPVTVAGIAADSLTARLRVAGGQAYLEPLELRAPAGVLRASGSLPLEDGEAALDLEVQTADLSAEPFASWLPADSAGTLSGGGRLGGTLDAPALAVQLAVDSLHLGGQDLSRAGPSHLDLNLAQGALRIDGAVGDVLTYAGGGTLTEHAAAIDLDVTGARLAALVEAFAPGSLQGLDGSFHGTLELAGDPAAEDFAPQLEIDRLDLTYGDKVLSAIEPVRVAWRDDGIEIESFYLGDSATESEIFLSGRVDPADEARLDLRGQVSLDTVWFEPFLPGIELEEGSFDALATVEGTLEQPQVNGQGELRQRRIRAAALDRPIDRLSAVVLFYPGSVVLDEAHAAFASGTLRAAGNIVPYAEGGPQYRLQLVADDLQLRYPEGWRVRGGAELNVTSEPDGRVVSGQVTIASAAYSQDVAVGVTQLLQGAFARRPELVDEPDEELVATRLNIFVRGPGALRIHNNVADLRGDLDLVVRGSLARPVVFGEIQAEPGGTLLYSGNVYDVRRAGLQFTNPYRLEPEIDLVATTRMRQYDVTLDVAGTLDRLNVNFASNPPLADLDVLALVAGGEEPRSTDLPGAGEPTASSAQSFLYGQAASVVANRFNRLFGLDKFRIDPLTGESGNLSSARVTVGKRLGRDLFATYSYDPSLNELQILQLEWQISRQLTLVATQNGDGSFAMDARWEKSF